METKNPNPRRLRRVHIMMHAIVPFAVCRRFNPRGRYDPERPRSSRRIARAKEEPAGVPKFVSLIDQNLRQQKVSAANPSPTCQIRIESGPGRARQKSWPVPQLSAGDRPGRDSFAPSLFRRASAIHDAAKLESLSGLTSRTPRIERARGWLRVSLCSAYRQPPRSYSP